MTDLTNDKDKARSGGSALNAGLGINDGWEALDRYRNEMKRHQTRLARLGFSFFKLGDFSAGAKCAIEAAGLEFAINRIPKRPNKI